MTRLGIGIAIAVLFAAALFWAGIQYANRDDADKERATHEAIDEVDVPDDDSAVLCRLRRLAGLDCGDLRGPAPGAGGAHDGSGNATGAP